MCRAALQIATPINKLVSRIESLEGIVRNLGKVLVSDDPDFNQTATKAATEQAGEAQSRPGDDNNHNPWKIKSNTKTKITPLSQIMKV